MWAATQTVTLSVPGMTCSACPITVKKAISKVEGVSKVDVTFETREAVVTFDDAKTSVQKLTRPPKTQAIRPASSEVTENGSSQHIGRPCLRHKRKGSVALTHLKSPA